MFEEHTAQNCWRGPGGGEPWPGTNTGCWARCCSPKPAIAALASDHHRQFVPSLVPNHPTCAGGVMKITPIKSEYPDIVDLPRKKRKISSCVGCGAQIHDQYILRVAPDLEWHAACLKCADCQQFLDENCTCFVRDGKTYCKRDYVRLFGTKCDKCKLNFNKNDLVMRAKTKIYHIDCFRCNACQKQLIPGDEFALREDGLFCKEDHEELASKSIVNGQMNNNNNNNSSSNNNETITRNHVKNNNNNNNNNNNISNGAGNSNNNGLNANGSGGNDSLQHRHSNGSTTSSSSSSSCGSTTNHNHNHHHHHHHHSGKSKHNSVTSDSVVHHHPNNEGSNSDSSECGSTPRYGTGGRDAATRSGSSKVSSDGKPTRVRTVLNEKQLHTLRTCYSANPRPDALMKEQLVDMTGLSPRVIRVWFQNKRCKDKKRAIAMKQQLQQEKDGRKMGYGSMQGIPMVASSPVRHESPIGISPIEVQSYPAPWKALSDFALHTDLDRLDPSAPHFQQLVNQMHGYDLPPRPLVGVPHHEMVHQQSNNNNGHLGPLSDLIHQDSTESLITYMESDDSITHDGSSP